MRYRKSCHPIPLPLCLQDDAGTLFDSSIPTAGVSDHSEMVGGNGSSSSGGPSPEPTLGNTTTVMSFKFLVPTMVHMFLNVCEIPCGYVLTRPTHTLLTNQVDVSNGHTIYDTFIGPTPIR